MDQLEALRHAEREILRRLQQEAPDQLVRSEPVEPKAENARIGITGIPPGPRGYIRLFPQDFIVEEISPDGSISTIDLEVSPLLDESKPTLFADVVKLGIGTLEAVAHLAAALDVPPGRIQYAGMKDTLALTSQQMSLPRDRWQQFAGRSLPQLYVKPKRAGEGFVRIGELQGNRFTILVRTEEPMDARAFSSAMSRLAADGFANFYGPQRFGARLLNSYLGMLLCRGEEQEAVWVYLTAPGPFDPPLHRSVRERAGTKFGHWEALQAVFDELPYSFRREQVMVHALRARPGNWRHAISSISDQARFWIYGYASYLVNQVLSQALTAGVEIPEPLPLPLGGPRPHALYQPLLERDGTARYADHLRRYWFFVNKPRSIQPWIFPDIHGSAVVSPGVTLSFTLPRAAYATTFLMFLFQLHSGVPVPTWVRRDSVDARATLGMEPVVPTLERLGPLEPSTAEGEDSSA